MPLTEFHLFAIILLALGVILAGHFLFPKNWNYIFHVPFLTDNISFDLYLFLTQTVSNQFILTDTQRVGMAGVSFYSFLEYTGSVRLSF